MRRYLSLLMLTAVLLGGCGPETLPPAGSGRAGDLVAQETASATPLLTVISPLPGPQPAPGTTVVEPFTTATTLPTPSDILAPDVIATLPPIPTPDLQATTVPELDGVALANIRPLQGVAANPGTSLPYSWSPDGTQFLGSAYSGESMKSGNGGGTSVMDLIIGDAANGQTRIVRHNAGYPSWSRDGQQIYYLAARQDSTGIYYDLYRQAIDLEAAPELILQNVRATGTMPAVQETTDGQLLLSNQDYQPALVQFTDDTTSVVSIAEMVGVEQWGEASESACAALAPDGATAVVIPVVPPYGTGHLVDLTSRKVLDAFNDMPTGSSSCLEVTWSTDSTRLTYANDQGVFEYDLQMRETRTIVSRVDLGFPDGDLDSRISRPVWLPGEQLLLFSAGTPEWNRDSGYAYYLFVVQRDGSHLRPLAPVFGRIFAGDRSQAIVDTAAWSTQYPREHSYFLVDIVQQ